ncbi:hypothetical protein C7R92_19475 [Brevibacillus porteri]|uniref:Uncharacterized protein n=1 Tax=Brevibacillus porteri TaxID=2126350 RepID=A0ABX5FLE0_9BACL|nr:hypothetical protein C7R92_19475 [Brevibacillus porteri]
MDEVNNMVFIALSALYLNPILAILFFVNFTFIMKKIVNNKDYRRNAVFGSLLIVWILFSYGLLIMAR